MKNVWAKVEVSPETVTTEMRNFDTGAIRGNAEEKLEFVGFISPIAQHRFAEYMHKHRVCEDGRVRSSGNWKKGIPIESYVDSFLRHANEFHEAWDAGQLARAEEIACALFFNVQGFLHERVKERGTNEANRDV
jgi:hypothetical protein